MDWQRHALRHSSKRTAKECGLDKGTGWEMVTAEASHAGGPLLAPRRPGREGLGRTPVNVCRTRWW